MRIVVLGLVSLWAVFVDVRAAPWQKPPEPVVDPALVSALLEEGSTLFGSDCAACHASEGAESVGPPMTSNAALANKDQVITRILEGMPAKGMPPFAANYTDRKVAAVATFVRGSFQNAYPPIVEADVERVRAQLKKKSGAQ